MAGDVTKVEEARRYILQNGGPCVISRQWGDTRAVAAYVDNGVVTAVTTEDNVVTYPLGTVRTILWGAV